MEEKKNNFKFNKKTIYIIIAVVVIIAIIGIIQYLNNPVTKFKQNLDNMDISKLMNTLSKMDKKDLENGIKQLNQVLSSGDNKKIIEQLKNNMNK